jgi:hypothetical protein
MMKLSRPKLIRRFRWHLGFICTLFLILVGCVPLPVNNPPTVGPDVSVTPDGSASIDPDGDPIKRSCPDEPEPRIVEIREANPEIDKQHYKAMRDLLIQKAQIANTTILLGPNVVLDFSDAIDSLPVSFAPCVTLTSASTFKPDTAEPDAGGLIIENIIGGTQQPARTPHSLGPLLKFDPQPHLRENYVFLLINCEANTPPSDNVRISGFRLYGPKFGQQSVDDIGIQVKRCLNIEISNMEIAGWGGQAIQVVDEGDKEMQPEDEPGQEQPNNLPGERIGRPEQVRIFHNYIHHNQHPQESWLPFGGHAAGYGVDVHHGAWAQVYENVFDFNRHAIAAAGDTGGYEAFRNLVLKGGGVHNDGVFTTHTHQFDVHGSGPSGKGGQAGVKFLFANNSFQYLADNAIYIRGTPQQRIDIHDNVFAHEGLEDDRGDDAIRLQHHSDIGRSIFLGPNNVIDFDSYGRYGVCDFDGDGIDDLFLATGKTWWYSSFGEFQWTYLSDRTERLNEVRLGYFDDDKCCDVLTQSGPAWVIASGGTGPWQSIGAFGAPLNEVTFGRFDPSIRDHRPGVTRRTTHAFWRTQSGEWLVTALSAPAWQHAGSSSFPMSKLRFGDFTGDGVTDVLAVENGRWAISESALFPWRELNPDLSDAVENLYIANMDPDDNIDDILRLEFEGNPFQLTTLTWWRSRNGTEPWQRWKVYDIDDIGVTVLGFVGRFGAAPGGGTLVIGEDRFGHFYSEAEIAAGAAPDWTSLFPY